MPRLPLSGTLTSGIAGKVIGKDKRLVNSTDNTITIFVKLSKIVVLYLLPTRQVTIVTKVDKQDETTLRLTSFCSILDMSELWMLKYWTLLENSPGMEKLDWTLLQLSIKQTLLAVT